MNKSILIIIPLLIISFTFALLSNNSFGQQAQPTQPEIWISHTKPAPDLSVCHSTTNTCIPLPFTDTSVWDYCGTGDEYFSNYPAGQSDCGDPAEYRSSTCHACECPSGQIRIDHICVPDRGCPVGVEDFVTGQCYNLACPYGDGSPDACSHPPKCVDSENTTLVIDVNNNASCQCTGNKIWDTFSATCHLPNCNGDFGSPFGSVFNETSAVCECPSQSVLDPETNTCVSTNCPSGQIFVGNTHQCENAANCPVGYDIKAQDNSCYNPKSGTQICSNVDYDIKTWMHAVGPNDCVGGPHELVNPVFPCLFWNAAVQNQINDEYDNIQACHACASPNVVDMIYEPSLSFGQPYRVSARCITPQQFCTNRHGVWRSDLNRCVDGELQPSIPIRSSASSSSAISHSSSSVFSSENSSMSSSSLSSTTGGAGGSSGSNNSTGGGGGDNGNGGDGSGGGTGSAGSVASNASSAIPTSTANSSSNNVSSVAHSATGSLGGGGSSVSGSTGSNTSSGSGTSSGSNTSNGNGGGGGGTLPGDGHGGSAVSAGSAGNNSSANSSKGQCDPEASDYLDCIGKNKKPFPDHSTAESGATTFAQVNQKFYDRVKVSPVVGSFSNVAHIIHVPTSTCPQISIDLTGTPINAVISTDAHCNVGSIISTGIAALMIAIWVILGFRILASA